MKSHPDIHVGLGGERIGRKGRSKLFSDFVVAAPVPPQDRVLARPVLASGVLDAVAPLVAQVVNLCAFLGYLPLGAAHAPRWPPVAQVFNLCVLRLHNALTGGA